MPAIGSLGEDKRTRREAVVPKKMEIRTWGEFLTEEEQESSGDANSRKCIGWISSEGLVKGWSNLSKHLYIAQ
ncbi:hypothetical protein PMSM_26960 [Paenibacillus macquariensis subsp. macquariensis]|nr:hypothetical protein PMSM_26960 [Paenibacillus macquariensis subsp. macquariensis]